MAHFNIIRILFLYRGGIVLKQNIASPEPILQCVSFILQDFERLLQPDKKW